MMSQLITEEIAEKPKPVSGNLEVRILRSVPELEEVRNIWTAWNHHPNSDIDLYLLLLETRPEILRPHIVVLYRGGAPVAMLIGRIVNQRMELKIGYKTLPGPRVRLLSFVTGGMLGDFSPDNCKAAVSEVVNCLRRGEADIAAFHNIRTHEPIHKAVRQTSGFLNRDYLPALETHRAMSLPGSAEQLYAGLSSKSRKNLKWQAKKLLQTFPGKLRIDCLSGPAELEQMVHDVEEIAKKTYQRGLGVGFVETIEMRKRLYLDAQNGRLRAFVLYLADQPCAFWLGTIYQSTFHSGWMGYDPTYSKYSVGMFLVTKVTEDLCKQKEASVIEGIDFGLGDAQYKEVLGNKKWQDATVYIFGSTLRGLGFNLLRTPIIIADKVVRRAVKQTGLLLAAKRNWRNMVRPNQNREPSEGNSLIDSRKVSQKPGSS